MVTLERPYKIVIGASQCTKCKRNVRKSYISLKEHWVYCADCVNEVFNVDISREELAVPNWLISYADGYFYRRLFLHQYRGVELEKPQEFIKNMFNPELNGGKTPVMRGLHATINGRQVKRGHLLAVQHHLNQRIAEYIEDLSQGVRKLLVCPNCTRPMYYTGESKRGERGRDYTAYTCLAPKGVCANSNSNRVFAFYGGNKIEALEGRNTLTR